MCASRALISARSLQKSFLRSCSIINTPNNSFIWVYGIKCTVVSQQSTYVQSAMHDHQRGGGYSFKCSCIHLFKCLYILSYFYTHPHTHTFSYSYTPSHTHPHTHTPSHTPLHTYPYTPTLTHTHTLIHHPHTHTLTHFPYTHTLTHTHTHTLIHPPSHTHPYTPLHATLTRTRLQIPTQMTTASHLTVKTSYNRVVVTMPTSNLLFLFTEESISISDMEKCPYWCWGTCTIHDDVTTMSLETMC